MSTSKTDELLGLSRQMLEAAGSEEWEKVHEIETRRSELLAGYAASTEARKGRAHVEASLQEILAISDYVLKLSLKMREELQGSLSTVQRGIKAGHAYRQNE